MKILRIVFLLLLICPLAVALNRMAIPDRSTAATHFNTLIVLGYPANTDGTPSPEQRERVLEAVREYKLGVAPNIIMTGGAAHNQYVEAHVMTVLAANEGVPVSAIVEEGQAQNTIQNIYYSSQIMQARNWRSAEVISSPAHLGRAAMILNAVAKAHPDLAIAWRTHAAKWPAEYSFLRRALLDSLESSRCLQIRIFGFPDSRFLPRG